MKHLDFVNGAFVFTGEVRDAEEMGRHMSARALPGDEPKWAMPATYDAFVQLPQRYAIAATPRAAEQFIKMERNREVRAASQTETPPKWDARTYELQDKGISWLKQGNGILADEMGTGKTVQACVAAAAVIYPIHGDVLIVTTKSTVGSWVYHTRRKEGDHPFLLCG